jgi:hypothetical protein
MADLYMSRSHEKGHKGAVSTLHRSRKGVCTYEGHIDKNTIRQGGPASSSFETDEEWDFGRVQEWVGKNGIEWHLVPTGGQHFNGQAERMIGILKKQVHQSFEGRKYTHEETCRRSCRTQRR